MIPKKVQELTAEMDDAGRKLVLSAYEAAAEALEGHFRSNSRPFVEHPVGVASIVREEMGLDAAAVAANFLHEANRFQASEATALNRTPLMESFRAEYPAEVMAMVEGLNNISAIKVQETNLDEERYRKLIISYSPDPRVVFIKLADRLEVVRNISIFPPAMRQAKLMETMLLYIPLAHQLGMYHLKNELEEAYLKVMEPKSWESITQKLEAKEKELKVLYDSFLEPIKKKLAENGISYKLKYRTKSAYSIWRKMQAQQVPFEKVFDLFAIRIILDCPPDIEQEQSLCWKVYSLITEEYVPDTGRLRDWISKPRDNGYESLHTTVTTKEGTAVEVQIRTARMDFIAEKGVAAHWSYKGVRSRSSLTDWISNVRSMLEGQSIDKDVPVTLDEILVYTPTGDLRQLHKGATVLDFAFEIHTNLGLHCTGGRVNGRMVSFREKLKTGDIVEIVSSKNQKPTLDWLNWVNSSKARSKIKQKLKEEEYARAAVGKELLARRLKNWKLVISDSQLHTLAKRNKYHDLNELFGAIGRGEYEIMQVKEFILSQMQEDHPVQDQDRAGKAAVGTAIDKDFVIDRKLKGVDLKLSKCCNPVYGDEIFGFLTIKEGIKVHRCDCPNASRLRSNYPYRLIEISWKQKEKNAEKADTHKGGKSK